MIEDIISELEKIPSLKISDFNNEDSLVVSIDMNNGFVKEGALASSEVRGIVDSSIKALKNFKEADFSVLAYTDTHNENSIEFKSYPIHCLKDTKEADIIDELREYIDVIIPKASTNGFLAKNPYDLYPNTKNFIISGCCTDICIYQFAITLKTYMNQNNLDGRVIVLKNLCETFNAPNHDRILYNTMALKSLMNNGIEVCKLEV